MTDDVSKIKEEEQDKLNNGAGPIEIEPERGDNRWLGGVVLIGVGLFFLLGNVFSVSLTGNWWAVFILIPSFYSLQQAWYAYKHDGYLSNKAHSNLIGGLLIGAVAFIFLFGLSFGDWWPLFLIIVGIGAILKRR